MATYNKYSNKKVVYDGKKFDSKGEKKRYQELKKLESVGLIQDLALQYKIELVPKFRYNGQVIRNVQYIADFKYFDCEKQIEVWEDFKGYETDVFKLKKKIVQYMIVSKKLNVEFLITKR